MAHSRAGEQGLVQWPRSQPPTPPDTHTRTHTCGWGLCDSHGTWQTRGRAGGREDHLPGLSCSGSFSNSFSLDTQHSAPCLRPLRGLCRVGALEGAAALPGEEHPALLNGRPGQRHPNLWVCRQALLGVSRPHSVTPVLGVQLMASCHQFFLLTSYSLLNSPKPSEQTPKVVSPRPAPLLRGTLGQGH